MLFNIWNKSYVVLCFQDEGNKKKNNMVKVPHNLLTVKSYFPIYIFYIQQTTQ